MFMLNGTGAEEQELVMFFCPCRNSRTQFESQESSERWVIFHLQYTVHSKGAGLLITVFIRELQSGFC